MRAFVLTTDWYAYSGIRVLYKALQLPKGKGESKTDKATLIADKTPLEELVYILPLVRPEHAAYILRSLPNDRMHIIEKFKKQDLIPLEHALYGPTPEYLNIGFNCFGRTGDDQARLAWASCLLRWTPATHHLTPNRVRYGSFELLKCLYRLGIKLPRDLRLHLIRVYAYSDYLYMKSMYVVIGNHDNDTQWKLLDDPIRTKYSRGSRCDIIVGLAHHKSSIDLISNTCGFECIGSIQTRVRSAFITDRYDEVLALLGITPIPYGSYHHYHKDTEATFYRTLNLTNSWKALYDCCGASVLLPGKISAYCNESAGRVGSTPLDHARMTFLFDLSRKRNDWGWTRNGSWTSIPLIRYAYALGGGWAMQSYAQPRWISAWRFWTPEMHADNCLYTLDFRYRARPLLSIGNGIGQKIVRWMACTISIDHTVITHIFRTRKENIEYLSRYTKYLPPKGMLAKEVEKLVVTMQKMVKLYCVQ